MPNGRPASVRSHRRGGARRGRKTALAITIPLATMLVASGLVGGYLWLSRQSCSGTASSTVIASPTTAPLLERLGRDWTATRTSVDGACGTVKIVAMESSKVAESLQSAWSTKWVGDAPDVWVPESTAWVRTASGNAETEKMMPDLQPSIARSPVVIAMPKPMAQALGWPKTQLDWADLIDRFAGLKNGWGSYGKDWGAFKIGMTDPATSTAGLLALSAIIDADDNEDIDDDELKRLFRLKQVMKVYEPNTAQILRGFDSEGMGGANVLTYVSAFPALEQEIIAYNIAHPNAELVAVYPKNNTEADNPYLTLNDTPWVDAKRQAVAGGFLAYLRSPEAKAVLQAAGFRDPNRKAGATVTEANGVLAELTSLPRGVLLTDAVNTTLNTWTSLTRPTNMLLVLDVSGSMGEKVPGLGRTKLDLTKEAARLAVQRFDDSASVGLWSFSSSQGGKPYRELVPLTKLGAETSDGVKGSEKVLEEIKNLKAGGNTGIYDTIAAAHDAVRSKYQADATNLVVILTDGANDDQGKGLTLDQLTKRLKDADPKRPVKVVTIALGQEANGSILQQISAATDAPPPFVSRDQYDITAVLLRAIFQTR
ncbi:Ca-activated chloride channel family protein [Allocatelliglobosispora scoriae]|uniref:Ca-activated chloride channel family protein n=1 Tax=Allocatelliglobosispora scoriae TaxID=643052 RepID=A0A841BIE3_9ACTN|nr:substrate-binding and VWA domain-containing protein [Allocatelliglobosispora scoriae]MBB5866956.1 Ca-activated chloride channel family protein [Allocatelliglobosispora scoriae]